MVQHLIAPVDGSDASWRAVDVALSLARRVDASVEVVEFVGDVSDSEEAEADIAGRLGASDHSGVTVTTTVRTASEGVAKELAAIIDARPDGLVVMSSHGRGRSAAVLGSVAEELLQLTFGPIIVVGPQAVPSAFDGPLIVAIDGSDASELALPLAAAWGIELRVDPWVVQVGDADVAAPDDSTRSAHVASLAGRLSEGSGHPVQFEVLQGQDVAAEITRFAASLEASAIVGTTHGRTGMSRLVMGSVAAALVRQSTCPVILLRPPHVVTSS